MELAWLQEFPFKRYGIGVAKRVFLQNIQNWFGYGVSLQKIINRIGYGGFPSKDMELV